MATQMTAAQTGKEGSKMKKYMLVICAVVVLALAGSVATVLAAAKSQVRADLPIPASIYTSATVDGCTNNPGPFITLSGELTLGEVDARLIFRNNAKGTHKRHEYATVDVALIPEGETIQFAKRRPLRESAHQKSSH